MNKFVEIVTTFDERKAAPGNEDSHYDYTATIQPQDLIDSLKLYSAEANIVKLVCRHPKKGKLQDILKAIWFCIRIIKRDYYEEFKSL